MTIQTYTPDDLERIIRLYDEDRANALFRDEQHEAEYAARSPVFCNAAPGLMDMPDRDTYLWRFFIAACQSRYGNYVWRPQYQKEGTCAGQSTKLGQDTVAAVNSVLYLEEFPGRFSVAGNYAGARVDIEHSPGRWQGASMVSMADWSTKYGALLLSALGLDEQDLDNDEKLAIQWCNTRDGVPTQYETAAKIRPIEQAPMISDARSAGKAIQNGNPVIQGSNLIPTGTRDKNGFGHVQTSGGHATLFWAVRYNPFGLLYQNSWSAIWGTGGKFPDDQPDGSVWLDEDESNAIISQRQTYALIGMGGLQPRKLPQ